MTPLPALLVLVGCTTWLTDVEVVDSDIDLPEIGALQFQTLEGAQQISAGQLALQCDTPTTCTASPLRDMQSLEPDGLLTTFWFDVDDADTGSTPDFDGEASPGEEDPRAVHEGGFGDLLTIELRLQ